MDTVAFTDQHKDPEAVEAWKSKIKDMLKNASANPRAAFKDSLNVALYKENPRKMSLKPEEIDQTDYAKPSLPTSRTDWKPSRPSTQAPWRS